MFNKKQDERFKRVYADGGELRRQEFTTLYGNLDTQAESRRCSILKGM